VDAKVKEYLASIGRKGGKSSRRSLSAEEAAKMVRIREARRAFRDYGDRKAWEKANYLCP